MIDNLNKFYHSREEVINFLRDYIEVLSDANYDAKQNENQRSRVKILSPKGILQRLTIALEQILAGNSYCLFFVSVKKKSPKKYKIKQ